MSKRSEELVRFAEFGRTLAPKSALRAENAMLRAKLDALRAAVEVHIRIYPHTQASRDAICAAIEAAR